jgi:hypothetical protein
MGTREKDRDRGVNTARATAMAIAALVLAACGGTSDAHEDRGTDASAVTPTDSARPATDGGSSASDSPAPGSDGAPGIDSAAPGSDGAASDGTIVATDAGRPGDITCGDKTCTPPLLCCIGFSGSASYECKEEAKCGGFNAKAKCDGPEDCTAGARCCSGFPSGSTCKATCGGDQEVCHSNTDCSGGKTCKTCPTPGGGPAFDFCVESDRCPF